MHLTAEDHAQCIQLVVLFAQRVDLAGGDGVSDLFQHDGLYGYDGFELAGRQEIDSFYAERRARGKRLSRHIFTPPALQSAADGSITGWCVLTLYAADCKVDSGASHVSFPIAVMDYHDRFTRDEEGAWRFAQRRVEVQFGEMPILVKKQQQERSL